MWSLAHFNVLPFLAVSAPHANLQYFAEKFLHVFRK